MIDAPFAKDDVLRGPRGGEVVVAFTFDAAVYVHSRHGWNTIARWLRHPEKYTLLGRLDRTDPLHVHFVAVPTSEKESKP